MESLVTRYRAVLKCLKALRESTSLLLDKTYPELHTQLRDSVIQRFEFTMDTLWKYVRELIEQKHGLIIEIISPREVLRVALQMQLINKDEFSLLNEMLTDRNLSSHTYNEILAEEMGLRIQSYLHTLQKIIDRLQP